MRNSLRIGQVGGLAVALGVGAAVMTGCALAAADTGSSGSAAASTSPVRGSAHQRAQRSPTRDHLPQRPTLRRSTATVAGPPARVVKQGTVNPDAMPPKPALKEIWVSVGSSLMGLAQAGFREFALAGYLGRTVPTLNQTLALNGYNLVPSSTELVTSAYGQWTYWPGGPTLLQGQQQYSVVDPATKQTTGTFGALVSTGSPFTLRSKYVELLVTSNDGANVGTGAGQVPPVGSLIATFDLLGGFGWSYSAMPSSPKAAVAFRFLTPFGDIPVPFSFDASTGIADHTVDNQPVRLGNGYSIAPADPLGETYLGTSGFLPYYTTVQAREVFSVRDPSGNTVGGFEGVVTPTKDMAGVNTQAILVTKVLDGDAGTTPGKVPPVGSVYNVMYQGSDSKYVLYSSLPSPAGDVVSVIKVNGDTVSNIATFPLNLLDASALPPVNRLPVAKGYSFLPISELVPAGVNGLPPREIQVQGYQQFGVYDAAGVQVGSFDADVATQLDMYGIHSQSLLVTKVTGGTAGTGAGDVPPVGSVIDYVYLGNTGFGTAYSARPSSAGTAISFKVLTPLVDIPFMGKYDATKANSGADFFDPFAGP